MPRSLYHAVLLVTTGATFLAFAWRLLRRTTAAQRLFVGALAADLLWLALGWLLYGFDDGADGMTPLVRRTTVVLAAVLAVWLVGRTLPGSARLRSAWERYHAGLRERAERDHGRSGILGALVLCIVLLAAWSMLRPILSREASRFLFGFAAAWAFLGITAAWAWSGEGASDEGVRRRRARIAWWLFVFLGVPALLVVWHLLS